MSDLPPGLDHEEIRKRLLIMRAEIKTLSDDAAGARKPVTLDQQSVGRLSRQDALQQQAMAKAQEIRRRQELVRLEDALQRLTVGDYGWCLECGEAIALKRLDIDPLATLCVGCAG